MTTIHGKIETLLEGNYICAKQLTASWTEGGDPNPSLRESTKLLYDGWIREYTMKTHSNPFYEFILPVCGHNTIVNGARFMAYGPWTDLEEECHAREWTVGKT
jgi:hypothetical protein